MKETGSPSPGRSDGGGPPGPSGAELVTTGLPVVAGSGDDPGSAPPPSRRSRAESRASEGRRVPWAWIAVGLAVLALVGRGVVSASLGSGGTPSAVATEAQAPTGTGAPVTQPVTQPQTSGPQTSGPQTQPVETVPTVAPTALPTIDRVTLPLATEVAATGPSVAPTSSAPAAPGCSVGVSTAMFWGGYTATVTIRNTGRTTVNGWLLTFRLPDGQVLTNGWNGNFSASGSSVRVADAGHNAVVPAGGSTQIGFQGQFGSPPGPGGPGGWGPPYGFALNGGACSS